MVTKKRPKHGIWLASEAVAIESACSPLQGWALRVETYALKRTRLKEKERERRRERERERESVCERERTSECTRALFLDAAMVVDF